MVLLARDSKEGIEEKLRQKRYHRKGTTNKIAVKLSQEMNH